MKQLPNGKWLMEKDDIVTTIVKHPEFDKEFSVDIENDGTLLISPKGYGDCTSENGFGSPVILEGWENKLSLIVWSDINQQDPTHNISLEGAQETLRKEE